MNEHPNSNNYKFRTTYITSFWRGGSVIRIVSSNFQKYCHSASWFHCIIFQTLCWNLSVQLLPKTIVVPELTKCNHNELAKTSKPCALFREKLVSPDKIALHLPEIFVYLFCLDYSKCFFFLYFSLGTIIFFFKSAKISEKLIYLSPWYTHIHVRIRGCAFHFVEIFQLLEIRSVFCLYLHGGLEFFN